MAGFLCLIRWYLLKLRGSRRHGGKPCIGRVRYAVRDATTSSWPKARNAVCRRVAAVW